MMTEDSQLANSLGAGGGDHSPTPVAFSSHAGGSASGSTSPNGSTDGLLKKFIVLSSPPLTISWSISNKLSDIVEYQLYSNKCSCISKVPYI